MGNDLGLASMIFHLNNGFFSLQEVEALESLSSALSTLIKANAMKYVKVQIIRRTIFASLMTSLAPIAWLKIGQIIGELHLRIMCT